MTITGLDLAVMGGYVALIFGLATLLSKRASKSTEEFFVSGRSLPWWVIGTSMVATTFAADTPLVVSGLVAKGGIFKNWQWWYWGIATIITVFLFARLWKRTGISTDAELIELRYDGRPAAGLRFYKASWFGIFQNILVIAWVMKAMAKIIIVVTGWENAPAVLGMDREVLTVICLFIVAVSYTALSGLWGVVMTDLLQFLLAMGGSVYLAIVSLQRLGGLDGLTTRLTAEGFDPSAVMRIIPKTAPLFEANPFSEFIILILVVWWTTYSVDGGGYLSQRLFAAKNEKHSVFGYLWFSIAHSALRPWPWIVVGLCGMAFFGSVEDPETYYPLMMKELLPPGIFGLVIASFFAAFMSTIDTQLNWGSSLVVSDLMRRFVWKGRSEKEYVRAARIVIVVLALLGALASFAVTDISFAWRLVISVTAGVGSVYIARWYWWRVNAWSEIAAMATAMTATLLIAILSARDGGDSAAYLRFPYSTAITAAASIVVWVSVTLLTRPVSDRHLQAFYDKVRPGGPGWKRFRSHPPVRGETLISSVRLILRTFAGLAGIYGCLYGIGKLILGSTVVGLISLALSLCGITALYFSVSRELTADEKRFTQKVRK